MSTTTRTLIKGGQLVNEGNITPSDIFIENKRIAKIAPTIEVDGQYTEINAEGMYILPGMIDDQVHFREPGLTHKACIATESAAAVAGGITSFMEMPNTIPNTLTQSLLQDKYDIAERNACANYSFYMGASNDNIEEVLKTNEKTVCGVKVFMGSSTGNMLVDNEKTLENIFSKVPLLIATHCEDEATIRANSALYRERYGEEVPVQYHPAIRSAEACFLSSSLAVSLAKKHNSRLHVLHISTAKETELFRNDIPLEQKRITAEACIHHLWFSEEDYAQKGNLIKWNPAIKSSHDREGIWKALLDNRIDVIATDHAPHTLEEKSQSYFKAPSGGPLVQHALLALLEKMKQGVISLERIVEKTAHNPSLLYRIEKRGYIREGYYADLVLVNPNKSTAVAKSAILSKCGWSPFENEQFSHSIHKTLVNGEIIWDGEKICSDKKGKRLTFYA